MPGPSGISDKDPWATSLGDLASFHLDADDIALEMFEYPNIWIGGSREDFSLVGGFEVAGAGVYLPASELAFENLVWGTV